MCTSAPSTCPGGSASTSTSTSHHPASTARLLSRANAASSARQGSHHGAPSSTSTRAPERDASCASVRSSGGEPARIDAHPADDRRARRGGRVPAGAPGGSSSTSGGAPASGAASARDTTRRSMGSRGHTRDARARRRRHASAARWLEPRAGSGRPAPAGPREVASRLHHRQREVQEREAEEQVHPLADGARRPRSPAPRASGGCSRWSRARPPSWGGRAPRTSPRRPGSVVPRRLRSVRQSMPGRRGAVEADAVRHHVGPHADEAGGHRPGVQRAESGPHAALHRRRTPARTSAGCTTRPACGPPTPEERPPFLEPWIQWITVHSGQRYARARRVQPRRGRTAHRAAHLGRRSRGAGLAAGSAGA